MERIVIGVDIREDFPVGGFAGRRLEVVRSGCFPFHEGSDIIPNEFEFRSTEEEPCLP